MDYIKFCRNYFALTSIPVALLEGDIPAYSALGEMLGIEDHNPQTVFWQDGYEATNPTFCRYSPEIEYG